MLLLQLWHMDGDVNDEEGEQQKLKNVEKRTEEEEKITR